MSDLISIKGGRDGLLLRLDDTAEWGALLQQLERQLAQNQAFFSGARLALDVGNRSMGPDDLAALLGLMQQHGVAAEALSAGTRESRSAARSAGLAARPLPRPAAAADSSVAEGEALLLFRTVRSGQVVRHSGHITLVGDVNPGGELIAGGSVVVWGRLRGFVHAGALGDATAIVCAVELRPTQLRIAGQIATAPKGAAPHSPEVARIEDGAIAVEPWESFKR